MIGYHARWSPDDGRVPGDRGGARVRRAAAHPGGGEAGPGPAGGRQARRPGPPPGRRHGVDRGAQDHDRRPHPRLDVLAAPADGHPGQRLLRGDAHPGYEPVGCLYDVVGSPSSARSKATPEDKRKKKKDGTWYANVRLTTRAWTTSRPGWRRRSPSAPEATSSAPRWCGSRRARGVAAGHLRHRDDDPRDEEGRPGPRNPDACFLYNRPCDFYDVCCRTASIEDETRFKRLESVHPELAQNDNAGGRVRRQPKNPSRNEEANTWH
jgi:hypothetical protein